MTPLEKRCIASQHFMYMYIRIKIVISYLVVVFICLSVTKTFCAGHASISQEWMIELISIFFYMTDMVMIGLY